MNNHKQKIQIPIRVAVAFFPLSFILFILAPMAYFMIGNAERSGENSARETLELESTRAQEHLQERLALSQQINVLNASVITQGVVDYRSAETLQQYFWNQVQAFDIISSIYFGNPLGGLADAGRNPVDDSYYLIDTKNFSAGDFYMYQADQFGNTEEPFRTIPNFDARTRGWYQNAIEKGDAVWSDAYILFTGSDLAVSASRPVYDLDGVFLGVVANDLFLSQLSGFLKHESIDKNGTSFILERSGLLISSSLGVDLFEEETEGVYKRISVFESETPLVSETISAFLTQFSDFKTIQEPNQFEFYSAENRYFVDIRPINDPYGLDWLVVVILPETGFMGKVEDNRRFVFYTFSLFALSALILELFSYRWVFLPLLKLNQAVKTFTKGSGGAISNTAILKEVNELTMSFNRMVGNLGETLEELNTENLAHIQAKENLSLSEARYRSVIEDAPGLVCRFLADGEITFVNENYAKYYDISANDLVGRNFLDLLHEDDSKMLMQQISSLSLETPHKIVTQRSIQADGSIRHQRWVNRALFSESGDIIGYQSFGEDIEEEYIVQQHQNALYRISQVGNRARTPNELYVAIHRIIKEIMPAENLFIALQNQGTDRLKMVYVEDETDPTLIETPKRGVTSYVYRTGEVLHCSTRELEELQKIGEVELDGVLPLVWLGIPLISDRKTIGVIAMQNYYDASVFGRREREFLEIISTSIANTITRQLAQAETNAYAQTNAHLFKASQELSQSLEIDTLYHILHRLISDLMDCETLIISTYDAEEKIINCDFIIHSNQVKECSGLPPIPLEADGRGVQSIVIRTGQPIIISDFMSYSQSIDTLYYINDDNKITDRDDIPADESRTQSAVATPIILGDKVVGVIQIMSYNLDAYTQEHLVLLQALSSQISFSTNNARLFKQGQDEIKRRIQAETQLKELNRVLEARVNDRTNELAQRIQTTEKLNLGMSNILSDLNAANAIVKKNARKLQAANIELEAFTYSVSHDLRAPLRQIESFSKHLENRIEDNLDETSSRYLKNIIESTQRMKILIEDLLTLSRTSRVDLHIRPINFNLIIESVRAQLLDDVSGREITWIVAPLPPTKGDSGLMKILWQNLIENAVKYTRTQEKTIIEIGFLSSGESKTTFFIRDNGVGFDNAYRETLFGVFKRLHKSDEFEGSGVGLTTVKRIIERHSGKVWAEGVPDKGATFYFSLEE